MADRIDFAVHRPDPRLRGIHHRAPIALDQTWSEPFCGWLEPARPSVKLMIGLGGRLTDGGVSVPLSWMGGLDARAAVVELEGSAFAAVDLELTPLGAYRVLGRPVAELAGACVELGDLLGAEGAGLADRVHAAPDWPARFALVEDVLLRRLERGTSPTPFVERAWDRLRASGGRLRIGALADELHVSRRHLTAAFTRETGLAPKVAARMFRFGTARRRIEREPGRWADIALDAGYTDQSHLNREFRTLAGATPTAWLARLEAERDRHRGEGLPFVQDELEEGGVASPA